MQKALRTELADSTLESLFFHVSLLSKWIEKEIDHALQTLKDPANTVFFNVVQSEQEIENIELTINAECKKYLEQNRFNTIDSYVVMDIIRVVADLRCAAHEAKKLRFIALSQTNGVDVLYTTLYREIKHISEIAQRMLRLSIDAFAYSDTAKAAEVVQLNWDISEEFRSSIRPLLTFMMEDPRIISTSLNIILAATSVERIANYTKNVAEKVIRLTNIKPAPANQKSISDIEDAQEHDAWHIPYNAHHQIAAVG